MGFSSIRNQAMQTLQAVQRKDSYAASELVRPEKAT